MGAGEEGIGGREGRDKGAGIGGRGGRDKEAGEV